ncbi:MAG: DUF2202 domain-containing protein [Chloroflexi bacterium]|nr:DUF2202 domain-containing protein [Chloroflexota bacterium]
MKIQRWALILVGVVVLVAFSAGAALAAQGVAAAARGIGGARQPAVVAELTPAEAAGLLLMREEEKLAHDVYVTLYDQRNLSIFQRIANSESAHTSAVKTLLDRYGLTDPVGDNAVGVLENDELQALYDQLVAQGSASLEGALRVGAAIEEIDILDLQEEMALTDKADILRVYQNLLNGSTSHLRAFVSTLERQTGEAYEPQYMTQAAYEGIIGASSGGNGGRGGGNGGGNGGGRGGR